MNKKKYTGKLIAIDMYNCYAVTIADIAATEKALVDGCAKYGMQLCEVVHHKEEDQEEYCLFAICKQGHVTLHIYPEIGFVATDIFSCYPEADPAGMSRCVRDYFDADKAKITLLDRGDFGSENDMKPHHRNNTRLIRRTQNLGGKLKKIMLKPRSI